MVEKSLQCKEPAIFEHCVLTTRSGRNRSFILEQRYHLGKRLCSTVEGGCSVLWGEGVQHCGGGGVFSTVEVIQLESV